MAMAPVYLAGIFRSDRVVVHIYSEFYSGPLRNLKMLRWPDMLVLSGLNTSFDRMRHLTAYARTLNPGVVIVVGGSLARNLPKLCGRYFDYVCDGDVEQLAEISDACFGLGYTSEEAFPRFDLAYWMKSIGYLESSRNCNFRCNFCSITAEGRKFQLYDLDYTRRQIHALGRCRVLVFLDQNFYGKPRDHYLRRVELLQEAFAAKQFVGWSALATVDLFKKDENIEAARRAGCIGIFSGLESFDTEQLTAFRKRQNLMLPQEQIIAKCMDAGLVFLYGLVFDPWQRSVHDFRDELEYIVTNPAITLPAYISIAIPMLGTPLFYERMRQGALLPNLKIRDMDGRIVCTQTKDPLTQVAALARAIDFGPYSRTKLALHSLRFFNRYRGKLPPLALLSGLFNGISSGLPRLGTNARENRVLTRGRGGTYVATSETVGSLYLPEIPVAECYREYFHPLHITDAHGKLHPDVCADLGSNQK